MIKVTYEFNTPAEAASFLSNAGHGHPSIAQPVYAAAPQAPQAPQQPVYAAAPQAPQAPQYPAPPQPYAAPQAPQQYAAPPGAAIPQAAGPTSQQVAAQAQLYAKQFGPKAARAKMAEFNLKSVSEANPQQLAALLQAYTF